MPIFIAFLSGVLLFSLSSWFPFSVAVLFLAASAILLLKKRPAMVLVVSVGMLYAFFRVVPAVGLPDIAKREIRLQGSFLQKVQSPEDGNAPEIFEVDSAFDESSGDEIEELQGQGVVVLDDVDADFDRTYELLLRTGADRRRLNPGGMQGGRIFGSLIGMQEREEKPFSLFRVFSRLRNQLNEYFLQTFSREEAGLIASVTTGETSYLEDDVRTAFNVTGMAHILSISGTHFGLFSLMIFGVCRFLVQRLPYKILLTLTMYLTPSQVSAMLSIPFMLMYLGISGGSLPAIRSFVMITLFLAGLLLGRKGFWLNSLLFAAILLVLWDPEVLFSISFQLSFLACIFIGFATERKAEAEKEVRYLLYLKNSLRITLAASIGTSLLGAYYFHYASLVSPLSNLLVSPLIGFILVPLSLLSSFAYLLTGQYLLGPVVGYSAQFSIAIVKLMAGMPYADLKIAAFPAALCLLFYAGFLLYPVFGRRKLLLLVPFIPLGIYAVFSLFEKKDLSVTFLDVGQGDSAVIELPDRRSIVVDAGRTGRETAAFLSYVGRREIDAVLLTHAHPDHTGGIKYLLGRFSVHEIWDNGLIIYQPELGLGNKRKKVARGDVIDAGAGEITVMHPYREFYTSEGDEYEDENNTSVVFKITGRKSSILFAGDISDEAEEDISYIGNLLKSDVIKIPHHGGRTSANEPFLAAVSPSIAVISVGRDNSFGHPSATLLEKLDRQQIFRTDRDGAIKITETDNGLSIKTYNEYTLEKTDNFKKEFRNITRLFSAW